MEFSVEERLDLLCSVCGELVNERDKYNMVKDMTEEEIEELCEGLELVIRLDKKQIENKIQRLERLKIKLRY